MGQGEYTVYFLEKFGGEDIPCTSLAYPGVEDLSLKNQVEAWLTEISDGVRIKIDTVGDRLELKFGYSRQDKPALYYSANNSGYGLSYVLSIITAIKVPEAQVFLHKAVGTKGDKKNLVFFYKSRNMMLVLGRRAYPTEISWL